MRAAAILLIALAVVAALAAIAMRVVDEKFVLPVVEKIRADTHALWPRALEDMKTVAAFAPMPPWHGDDAAGFMATRIPWEGESGGSLRLPHELEEQLRGEKWASLDPAISRGIDFGWMKELHRFDVWDLWTQLFARRRGRLSFVSDPLPHYVSLQGWAKLRLLRGKLDGDLQSASADVTHLANLLLTTNEPIGVAVGFALLKLDHHDSESALKASRSFMPAFFGLNVFLAEDELKRAIAGVEQTPFRCLATAGTARSALLFKRGLARRNRAQFDTVGAMLARNARDCRLDALLHAWNGDAGYEVEDIIDVAAEGDNVSLWRLLGALPVVNAEVYAVLGVMSVPYGFNSYKAH